MTRRCRLDYLTSGLILSAAASRPRESPADLKGFAMSLIKSLKADRFYVVDAFSGPVSGPFNSYAEAEADRVELSIGEDCVIGFSYRAIGRDGRPCMKLQPATVADGLRADAVIAG